MKIMYETDRIILTPFNREIANNSGYESWMYDQDVTRYNHWGLFPHSKKKEEAFLDMCESGEGDLVLAIMGKNAPVSNFDIKKHHWSDHIFNNLNIKHIGNLSLQSINHIYKSAEYAITIGDKNYWGQGIGYEASKLLFHHGFNKLNLHRIWTGTALQNKGMRELAMKLGMKKEGIFVDGMFLNGKYVDIIAYGILEEEWRGKNEDI